MTRAKRDLIEWAVSIIAILAVLVIAWIVGGAV